MPASNIFVSYSTRDAKFAEKLERRLQAASFKVFRDVHGVVAGRLDKQLKENIDRTDALLLIFSKHSAGSDWVEWEVQSARERERTEGIDLLCPISLDDAWRTATWNGPLMLQIKDYAILDFSKPRKFDSMLDRLIAGLINHYGP